MSIWALIDCENLPNLEQLNLTPYDRILLFCGPRNTKLNIESLPETDFQHLEILRII